MQADVYELDTILAVSADGATVVGTEDGYAITVRDWRASFRFSARGLNDATCRVSRRAG